MKQTFHLMALILLVPALFLLPACQFKHIPTGLSDPTVTPTFTPLPGSVTGTLTATWTPTQGTPTETLTPLPISPTFTRTSTSDPTPTHTPASPTATPTPTMTGSPTNTSTQTIEATVCPPTTIDVSSGSVHPTYGQYFFYDIRSQADWDAYQGVAGTTAPVDFSTQRLLVENWGTELCQTGGMVADFHFTSVCVNSASIDVKTTKGSTCTCGGSCVYIDGGTQVQGVVVQASSLPVSFLN